MESDSDSEKERVCTAFPSLVELRVEMHTYGACRIGYAVYKVYSMYLLQLRLQLHYKSTTVCAQFFWGNNSSLHS